MTPVNDPEKVREGHESLFVSGFILPESRQRWAEALASKKKRDKILHRLAEGYDFIPQFMHAIEPRMQKPEAIESQLKRLGASRQCYAISEWREIDSSVICLEEALNRLIGMGMGTVLSCIPGRLVYYEGEGPGQRWILRK